MSAGNKALSRGRVTAALHGDPIGRPIARESAIRLEVFGVYFLLYRGLSGRVIKGVARAISSAGVFRAANQTPHENSGGSAGRARPGLWVSADKSRVVAGLAPTSRIGRLGSDAALA
ncbi:hypothetical protein N7474_010201 [Penicillium riverlandense]|uniref:uncharacterized protein n=1 Tax=Penicillium riverlandense TaxID=1903569 RepID=UPI0025491B91|nr:uncharacterized protein N7474_010201 [Penicillium riverlandense]KAJ5808932.1 hypothetical protein N7474_010201 [Penicillium riverlandense]